MKATFVNHSDPGHGWLEVDELYLKQIGITADAFSEYSYRNGRTLYLEEDCDASKFLILWKEKFGEYPQILDRHHNRDFRERFLLCGIHD